MIWWYHNFIIYDIILWIIYDTIAARCGCYGLWLHRRWSLLYARSHCLHKGSTDLQAQRQVVVRRPFRYLSCHHAAATDIQKCSWTALRERDPHGSGGSIRPLFVFLSLKSNKCIWTALWTKRHGRVEQKNHGGLRSWMEWRPISNVVVFKSTNCHSYLAGFFERISFEIKMSLWKVLIIFHNDVSLNNSHLRSLFSPNLFPI